jgi:hypothetical protein
MHHESPLSLPFQCRGKKGPSGRSIGASHRHSRQSGGFIESHYGIVFVKHNEFP